MWVQFCSFVKDAHKIPFLKKNQKKQQIVNVTYLLSALTLMFHISMEVYTLVTCFLYLSYFFLMVLRQSFSPALDSGILGPFDFGYS